MSKFKIIVVVIIIYTIFLVVTVPARFVIGLITLPSNIALGAVQGTVWSGSVQQVNAGKLSIEKLDWQLNISQLLALNISADLTFGYPSSPLRGQGNVVFSGRDIWLNNITIATNVGYLTRLSPLPYGLTAHGDISVDIKQYHYNQRWCESLTAQVKLEDGKVASQLGKVPVETATLDLNCDNHSLVGVLNPATNSLGLDVKSSLSPSRQLNVSGFVNPTNDTPQDFINLLNFSSSRDSNGRYPISFNTQLR